jgi:hypothetical protein
MTRAPAPHSALHLDPDRYRIIPDHRGSRHQHGPNPGTTRAEGRIERAHAHELLLACERHQQDRLGRGDADRHDRVQQLVAAAAYLAAFLAAKLFPATEGKQTEQETAEKFRGGTDLSKPLAGGWRVGANSPTRSAATLNLSQAKTRCSDHVTDASNLEPALSPSSALWVGPAG